MGIPNESVTQNEIEEKRRQEAIVLLCTGSLRKQAPCTSYLLTRN